MIAIVMVALGLYLLISAAVVVWVIRRARRAGRSAIRWGLSAALILYLIPFWDWIPTVATHQYYCARESGFWVYKTVDQWKKENPGVMETLVDGSQSEKYPNWQSENWRGKKVSSLNRRFGLLYKSHLTDPEERELLLHVWRWQTELVDKETGEVLARRVDFSTGNGLIGGEPPIRFWLQNNHCAGSGELADQFGDLLEHVRGARP